MNAITTITIIGLGATIGASLRYYLGVWSVQLFSDQFAHGTLIANVLGSFIAGILLVVILEKSLLSETYRLLLLVGLCGSLTTFSAFSLETVQFFTAAQYLKAGLNIALNLVLSISAVLAGAVLMRYFLTH